ncbi:hypothetical protein [Streptomyces sp. NPDC054961]
MSTLPAPEPQEQTTPATAPFLPLHTAIVLLAAVVIGFVAGGLTFLSGGPAAGSVLAGLTAAGASVPVLRSLIQ